MAKLIKALDRDQTFKNNIQNPIKKSTISWFLLESSRQFDDYNINNYLSNKIKIKPKNIIIECETIKNTTNINNISELIKFINHCETITNISYNINQKALIKIKDPLIKLENMIGMNELKNDILDQILFYIQGLHENKGMEYMHTILYGPPGTGKTEVAKIIGEIFANIGILKNNTFKKVVRSDLIAGYLGQTAIKTSKVIEQSLGGVLFIDEAYSLGSLEKRDSFAKECIDTLCEALSNHKNNLMVIIAGYEDELETCFFSANSGLKSRFPWSFNISKYSSFELYQIFSKKIKEIDWKMDESINSKFFEKYYKHFSYYGRDIEILLLKCKIAHSRRIFSNSENSRIITYDDLINGYKLFCKNNSRVKESPHEIFNMYN
tara:strand:- start:100 stop:1236 length:1137 start_codon:yes stop_codon:yes gene_type:complete